MVGTYRTSEKVTDLEGVEMRVEPVCVMGTPEPSLVTIYSVPSYGWSNDKFVRSWVTRWDVPESRSQAELDGIVVVMATLTRAILFELAGFDGGRIVWYFS